jgi:hypothetical protein
MSSPIELHPILYGITGHGSLPEIIITDEMQLHTLTSLN